MSPKIHILPENLCNKIAAGEVIERPASVVKELVENALDAGGTQIFIDIEEAGRRLIRISDNGDGMGPEDARLAFERHATSKIANESDLLDIRTMGFRGEALPSIAAVARVRLLTARPGSAAGTEVRVHGGALIGVREASAVPGTVAEVAELFYNTPARKKFLKSNGTELAHILHAIQQQALAHPEVHFRLAHHEQVLLDFPSVRDETERAAQLIGPEGASDLLEVTAESGTMRLKGLISRPGRSMSKREHQEFFLNSRAIKNATLSHAVREAYETLLARDRHPAAYLFIEIDPSQVDVNVHPAKREVRFRDAQAVHPFVKNALRERLLRDGTKFTPSGRDHAETTGDRGASPSTATLYGLRRIPSSGPVEQTREAVELYRTLSRPEESSSRAAWAVQPSDSPAAPRIQPLGQVDQTYIVALVGSELHLLDQHAAHERLLFERLRSQQQASKVQIQPLLIPDVVEMSAADAVELRELLSPLASVGLEVEEFGERSFAIRALPAVLESVDGRALLLDILDEVRMGGMPAADDFVRSVTATIACHAAVKAHQPLRPEQMSRLLEDLYRQEVPSTCPHGRPIRMRFSLADLEKMFQRR